MQPTYIVLAELGTLLIVNFPSMLVVVPIDVPFTSTDAPTTGWLSSSEMTKPVIVLGVWAIARLTPANKQANNNTNLFFIRSLNIWLI